MNYEPYLDLFENGGQHIRMRFTLGVISFISSLLGVARGISLSDFRPQSVGLSDVCKVAYTTPIAGCISNDFLPSGNPQCSQECLVGLVAINNLVLNSCSRDSVPANSLIGIFLAGKGIRALCNVEVITKTTTGPTIAPAPATTITPIIGQSTKTAPLPTSLTGIVTDSSSRPPVTATIIPMPSSASAKSTMTFTQLTTMISTTTPAPATTDTKSKGSTSTLTLTSSTANPQAATTSGLPKCGSGGSPFDQVPGQTCTNSGTTLHTSIILLLTSIIAAIAAQRIR
ncbi:hypothetical protein BT63DRAFT_226904 [Microthyrium microscopicum]|uniref:Uncharacterized protein n=1 Tax=Microthyrium microscopicum TaxID=703497 RepID=A0A6A6UCK2_9PEZI|nr:hypothetical protein BT63DRAFT_226904 [Microthyrium microscopicum]